MSWERLPEGDDLTFIFGKLLWALVQPGNLLLLILLALGNLVVGDSRGWLAAVAAQLGPGRPLYLILYAALIIFCAFFYTAFVLDPDGHNIEAVCRTPV